MLKIKILSIGKTKEAWLEEALEEYVKRLSSKASIEYLWAKNDTHLLQLVQQEPLYICLDPAGKQMSSEAFAAFVSSNLQAGGSRLSFVIGGADGLPIELKKHGILISLSAMTFTHQITRLVLLEQIYRAFEIERGSKYHR